MFVSDRAKFSFSDKILATCHHVRTGDSGSERLWGLLGPRLLPASHCPRFGCTTCRHGGGVVVHIRGPVHSRSCRLPGFNFKWPSPSSTWKVCLLVPKLFSLLAPVRQLSFLGSRRQSSRSLTLDLKLKGVRPIPAVHGSAARQCARDLSSGVGPDVRSILSPRVCYV